MIAARSEGRTACQVSEKRKTARAQLLELFEGRTPSSAPSMSTTSSTAGTIPRASSTAERKCRSVTTIRLPAFANWCAICSAVEVL